MSDQDTSIFPGNTPEGNKQPEGDAPSGGDLTTLLGQIKNERGEPKYKSVEEALKALQHSQEYIPQLTTKIAGMETELNAAKAGLSKVEELERTVLQLTQKTSSSPDPAPQAITPEKIAEIVETALTVRQTKEQASKNLNSVVTAVAAKHGDKAEEVFYGKAKELGISRAEFNEMAAKSPAAVLSLLGLTGGTPSGLTQPKPQTFNTDGFQATPDTKVKRADKSSLYGATTQEVHQESENAKKLVEEIHAQGMTMHDLTNPKVYFQRFGK